MSEPRARAAAVDPAGDTLTQPDIRRITEQDADYRRLHARTRRALHAGLREYARALATVAPHERERIASRFIAAQVQRLRQAYLAAHWQGERDYWGAHSLPGRSPQHTRARHVLLSRVYSVAPDLPTLNRTLGFYAAASVTKMAREGLEAVQAADARQRTVTASDARTAASGGVRMLAGGGLPPELEQWLGGLTARVGAQSEIVWPGLQNGYVAAGGLDPANPYENIWWELEPSAQHCVDCPVMARQSPYSAPGSNALFGNELWVTPGDGTTDCGAGCKCTLRYGSSMGPWSERGTPAPATPLLPPPTAAVPVDALGSQGSQPGQQSPDQQGAPTLMPNTAPSTPPTRPQPDWTTAQVRALDNARAALIVWDRVRGDLPRLSLFASSDADLEAVLQEAEDNASIDAATSDVLTTAQKKALLALAAARRAYRKQVLGK